MLKIISPLDIILNEASKNETVTAFVDLINGLLENETENYAYTYKVKINEPFSKREVYLIEKLFAANGWVILLNISPTKDGDDYTYNVMLNPKA